MLEVAGLNQFYGQSHTLWDMDLEVPEGSCVCLMGRNGVGKTTLLKSVMGALPIRSGKINFMGSDIAPSRAEMRARKGIGSPTSTDTSHTSVTKSPIPTCSAG